MICLENTLQRGYDLFGEYLTEGLCFVFCETMTNLSFGHGVIFGTVYFFKPSL